MSRRYAALLLALTLAATLAPSVVETQGGRIRIAGGRSAGAQDPPPGDPDVLDPTEDLEYLGIMYFPASDSGPDPDDGTYYENSTGTIAVRKVGSEIRIFVSGSVGGCCGDWNSDFDALYEVRYNGVGTGNRATLVRNWRNIYWDGSADHRIIHPSHMQAPHVRGYAWDEDRGGIWWAYQSSYYTGALSQPTIGFSALDDGDGSHDVYGPWRTPEFAQKTKGWLTWLPEDFADTYTSGNRLAVGSPVSAQNGDGPKGAVLFAISDFDPFTLPADEIDLDFTAPASLTTQRILYHDSTHPQVRDDDYKITYWASPGNHSTSVGSTTVGATTMAVADLTLYGNYQSISAAANDPMGCNMVGTYFSAFATGMGEFLYTGKSAGTGAGNLTGIPTTGCGTITGTVANGTVIELGTYDSARGGVMADGSPDYRNLAIIDGKPAPGAGEIAFDYFSTATWVKTASKEGFVAFGQKMGILPGYDYETASCVGCTVPHMWYGPSNNNPSGMNDWPELTTPGYGRDPFGHVGFSTGTGPLGTTFFPIMEVWSRASMAAGSAGGSASWSQTPTSDTRFNTIADVPATLFALYQLGGSAYLASDRLLFVVDTSCTTDPASAIRPCAHVFRVAN